MKALPAEAKLDMMDGSHVCRHARGSPAVSMDQFWEQTYIKQGKGAGGLKGISTNCEQVAVWTKSFSICSHLVIQIDNMYGEAIESIDQLPNQHKEEGIRRRNLDKDDHKKLTNELQKHSHPLTAKCPQLHNIVSGQCATSDINVHNALEIGLQQEDDFNQKLPESFHKPIKRVKTMQSMKKASLIQGKTVYDLEAIFAHLLLVGQQ